MLFKKLRFLRKQSGEYSDYVVYNESPRGKNEGPPDLEELWRDFNRRLGGLFGNDKGNGGPGGPARDPSGWTPNQFGGGFVSLIFILGLIWVASSSVFMVDASQRAVVKVFGRYDKTVGEGLQFRWPSPIGSHEIVNVTGVRTVEVGYKNNERNKIDRESLMLTDDENIITIQFAVQYILNNPEDYVFQNRDTEESVKQVAETAMREIVGKSKMDFVLYGGREQIAAEAHKMMQAILDRYRTGIQISRVTLQNAQPPEQVQAAFNDAVKAGQDKERQRNEGQAYANDVIPKAQGTAARLNQEAEAYKARVTESAIGDASRFKQVLTEYQRAPAITRERMYLETMEHIFANTAKVMLDAKGSGNLLYLPLDKLMAHTTNAAVGPVQDNHATPAPAPQQSVPAPTPPQEERRNLRSFRGERQ